MTTLPPDSRFASPTSSLDPAGLLRPLRKVFLVSLGVALACIWSSSPSTPSSRPPRKPRGP